MRALFSTLKHAFLRHSRLSGFSLIELALVLAIVGVIAGFSLPFLMQHLTLERIKITRHHQERILESLGAYLARTGHVPCPSHSKPSLGEASLNCHKPGMVPFVTLGLDARTAKDGFGRYFTYAVDPSLNPPDAGSEQQSLLQYFCQAVHTGLSIKDLQGRPLGQGHDRDFVAVVLVSHGPQGIGAYDAQGKSQASHDLSSAERINNAQDLNFVDYPYQEKGATSFRHIVRWVSRNNLAASYAKIVCQAPAHQETPITPSSETSPYSEYPFDTFDAMSGFPE